MKKIKKLTFLIICLSFSVTSLVYGNNNLYPNYKIKEITGQNLEQGVAKAWKLIYETGNQDIFVYKRVTKAGNVYVVNSDYFQVCYEATSKKFGVRALKSSWCLIPEEMNQKVLNQDELRKQRVILPGMVDDKEALELIAGFLPNLLQDNFKHLLN